MLQKRRNKGLEELSGSLSLPTHPKKEENKGLEELSGSLSLPTHPKFLFPVVPFL